MCELTFEYQTNDVPEEIKSDFEERINKKLKLGCQTINKAGGFINVSWHGDPRKLRGLLIMDESSSGGLSLDFKQPLV